MSVSARDLLSLAERLLADAQTEIDLRNAAGRAYYAAYQEAVRYHDSLPSKGREPPKKVGVHAELAYRLLWPTIPQSDARYYRSQNISRHLSWLHDKRVKADYRDKETFTRTECEEAVKRAGRLLELCQ